MKAKVKVRIITKTGAYCLKEIKGLEENTIIEGTYNPKNKSFKFIHNEQNAILWIGENAELIEQYNEPIVGSIVVSVAICINGKIIEEKDTMKEAKKYAKENNLKEVVEYWYLASEIINEKGDVNPACWGKTRHEAINKLKRVLGN